MTEEVTQLDFAAMGTAAAETEDLTKDAPAFERKTLEKGPCLLRLRTYIETGRHASRNPAHKPALGVSLVFEVSSKKHLIDIDGNLVPSLLYIDLNKGSTGTSRYRKLFNSMNKALGGKHKNFLTMINQPLKGEITHNITDEGTEKAKTWANIDDKGVWSFVPAERIILDEDGEEESRTPLKVRELHGTPTAFLWENAGLTDDQVIAMWNCIHIEGTRTSKDKDGTEKVVSKNTYQEKIMANLEWEGSRTQALTQENILDESLLEEEIEVSDEEDVPTL